MRAIILATALITLAPATFAQSPYPPPYQSNPPYQSPYPSQGPRYAPGPTGDTPNATRSSARPDPENCGTPDEPKACPPMPRRPLNYYPPNRQ